MLAAVLASSFACLAELRLIGGARRTHGPSSGFAERLRRVLHLLALLVGQRPETLRIAIQKLRLLLLLLLLR